MVQQEVRPGDAVPKVDWLSIGDYNSLATRKGGQKP
jgi:hypothetical protein